jgi:hypothetical protein
VTDEHLAVYNAIRATGSNSMIGMEGATRAPLNPSYYAGMYNIHWDDHFYDWTSGYSSDVGTLQANLQSVIAPEVAITSADGVIPMVIGEFGDSTDGSNEDPGGMTLVQVVLGSGYSWCAWGIYAQGTSDALLGNGITPQPSDGLTSYGQLVAQGM